MKHKKILFVVESMGGGDFTYIVDLANALAQKYDMYIAYGLRRQTPENFRDYFEQKIHLIHVSSFTRSINPIQDIKAFFEVRQIAEQIQQIQANVSYLKEELQIISDGIGIDDPYLTVFLTCQNIQSLNRGILAELINAIWVHENGEITIDFNFADEYQRIVDQMENDHNVIT